jgi:hypothetical protein
VVRTPEEVALNTVPVAPASCCTTNAFPELSTQKLLAPLETDVGPHVEATAVGADVAAVASRGEKSRTRSNAVATENHFLGFIDSFG